MFNKARLLIGTIILSLISLGWIIGDIFLSDYGTLIYVCVVAVILFLMIMINVKSKKV
jgi:hypothetical protein